MQRLLIVIGILALLFSCQPSAVVTKESKAPSAHGIFPPLYVVKEKVNLRSKPSASSAKVARLQDGDALTFLTNKNGWYQVRTEDGQTGWLRSDLAGPRALSKTRMAAAFADSILPAFNAKLFFDKTDLYKTVYLTLPASFYSSKNKALKQAKKIGRAYQNKVYKGAVEIRILKPESQELFTRLTLSAVGLARVPLPVLDFGFLFKLEEQNKAVKLFVAIPKTVSKKALLKSARRISATYDYPFTKAEIYMVTDSAEGMRYLAHFNKPPQQRSVCRLYYLEDANGEDFKFHFCDR